MRFPSIIVIMCPDRSSLSLESAGQLPRCALLSTSPSNEVGIVSVNSFVIVYKLVLVLLACFFSVYATLTVAAEADKISARIQSPVQVCVVGQACAGAMVVASAGAGTGMPPEQIYQTFCTACHSTGVNNSPVFADAEAWAPRIAKGIDVLYASILNGLNNGLMPAKGLCMACSTDELNATVDYLVQAAQAAP